MDHYSITVEDSEPPSKVVNSERCISKVHVGLRNVKPIAYKPVVVSIGPYHKANPDLQAMQQNKELYLNLFLERRNKSLERRNKSPESRAIYQAKLSKFDSKARKCYADPVNSNIDEFAEMMLLDACFIGEFLRKMNNVVEFDGDDQISRVQWMQYQILSDMMLLENQLPYFVLSEVYNMTKSVGEKPLEEMVMSCFNFMLPRPRLNSNNAFGDIGEINHLLHLVHVLCHPLPKKTTMSNEDSNSGSDKNRSIEGSSGNQTCCPLLPQNNEIKNQMGTVVGLQEAGVKFKKVGRIYNGALKEETTDKYVSLFDIDFKNGVMKVPCFKVEEGTETLLRNLIAYEQHFPNVHPKYFTDFACLMNQLINSKNDAKALRLEGIIVNFLGGNDELSKLFNRLTDNVCESYNPYNLEVRQKVDKHCKTKLFQTRICVANLKNEFSTNPYYQTLAAGYLVLLTAALLVVAVLTLQATECSSSH